LSSYFLFLFLFLFFFFRGVFQEEKLIAADPEASKRNTWPPALRPGIALSSKPGEKRKIQPGEKKKGFVPADLLYSESLTKSTKSIRSDR
jgi:hypothetical protein